MKSLKTCVAGVSSLFLAFLWLLWCAAPAAGQEAGAAGRGIPLQEICAACSLDFPQAVDDPMLSGQPQPESSKWEFVLTPYLFAVSVDQDVGVRGLETNVDADFGDIWDVMEFGGGLSFAAAHERWTFFADGILMVLENEADGRFTEVEVDYDQALVELGAAYRIGKRSLSIEPLAGARYVYNELEIDFDPGPSQDGSRDWLDPFIGARFNVELLKNLTLSLRGDVGGFGIGSGSDLTIHAFGTISWEFARGVQLIGGYRHYDVDYDHDDFIMDGYYTGPVVGLGFEF